MSNAQHRYRPIAHECEVAVIGGGPAGAAVARLLALWGRDVVLVTAPSDPTRDLAVSLPPSVAKLLAEIGVLDAVDAAGFVRSTGNTVWWGDKEPRSRAFADGTAGYQVRHRDFDRVLLAAAEAAGAKVIRDATVREADVERQPTRLSGDVDGVPFTVDAAMVLDASGRQGVVAKARGLRVDAAARTIALVGTWRRDGGWEVPDDSHTLVESFTDGWAWSVPVEPGLRYFTCMLDPRVSEAASGDLGERYMASLGRAACFGRLLQGATMDSDPWGCDASGYHAESVAGDRFLLVGDAASSIDPLSSFGVKKALGSAWLAAIVSNTVLSDAGLADAARSIFEDHERRVYETFRRQAAGFFDQVAADEEHAFWTGRAERHEEFPGEPDIARFRDDPSVLAAFEALKASSSIRLVVTPQTEVIQSAVIGDRKIVLEDHLATPSVPEGLRFLRGVDVRRIVDLAGEHDQVPDLFESYNGACPPVPLPDFLGALSVLLAKDVLRNDAVC